VSGVGDGGGVDRHRIGRSGATLRAPRCARFRRFGVRIGRRLVDRGGIRSVGGVDGVGWCRVVGRGDGERLAAGAVATTEVPVTTRASIEHGTAAGLDLHRGVSDQESVQNNCTGITAAM
jgi:hypothetical protein